MQQDIIEDLMDITAPLSSIHYHEHCWGWKSVHGLLWSMDHVDRNYTLEKMILQIILIYLDQI